MYTRSKEPNDAYGVAALSFPVIVVMYVIWRSELPIAVVMFFGVLMLAALFWRRWPSAAFSIMMYIATGIFLIVHPFHDYSREKLWLLFVICLIFPALHWWIVLSEEYYSRGWYKFRKAKPKNKSSEEKTVSHTYDPSKGLGIGLAFFPILFMASAWIDVIPEWVRLPAIFLLIAALFWRRWPSLVLSLSAYIATIVLFFFHHVSNWFLFIILLLFATIHWNGVIYEEQDRHDKP